MVVSFCPLPMDSPEHQTAATSSLVELELAIGALIAGSVQEPSLQNIWRLGVP